MLSELKRLSSQQRSAVLASYLGWTLDAFDFFILVFVVKDVAKTFGTDVKSVAYAVFLTLAARPVGALIFGLAADKYGRRPTLMVDIVLFSVLEFASGFAPSLVSFLVLRVLFGVAMGGEWGVGASLTMETIDPKARGVVSGILQAGYPSGYLIASIVFAVLFPFIGWRGMFMVGAAPALLVLYIRSHVDESPVFLAGERQAAKPSLLQVLKANIGRFAFAVALIDRLQLLQPRHAGPLSDLPARADEVRRPHHRPHRHRLQHRGDLRRHLLRHDLREDRPPPRHRPGGAAGPAGDPVLVATAERR